MIFTIASFMNAQYIGKIYYDTRSRTVYIKPTSNYDNPVVYFAGESIFGGCIKPLKYVLKWHWE